jgi:protein-disulfide isomerase
VLACMPLLMGGACEKKSTAKGGDPGAVIAADHAADPGAVDNSPLPGVDLGKLDADKQKVFYELIGSLTSPCGKGESLRAAVKTATCKRAPFAVRYVLALLEDEAKPDQAQKEYELKYKASADAVKIDTRRAPHLGTEDAPIRLVEFYDYGCPHCALFRPVMDKVLADEQGKVVTFFMMYPLEKHPDSRSAAQAAIAANAQGKFKEMHELLFENMPNHNHEFVTGYAQKLGLDMTKFEQTYAGAAAQVDSDHKQGENVGVDSTPTMFFNDRKYEGPMHPKYIELWIDEELAVNR